jgi:uncharacterized protein (DUF2141 family)
MPMKTLLFLLLIGLCGYLLPESHTLTSHTLTVMADNFENSDGYAEIRLFNQSEGFPAKKQRVYKMMRVKIENRQVAATFSELPDAEYAVAVLHDENNNGNHDATWYGKPTEAVGTSNNPTLGVFSQPNFKKSKFRLTTNQTIHIKMVKL